MDKMCWACTELYDDSLDNCPFCGVSKDPPVREPFTATIPKAPEPKRSHTAKVPVTKTVKKKGK